MAYESTPIGDLETLRAFLHPLRIRLLRALRVDGPATATELARRLGESSGATSYHLRQLARFSFVVEDEDQPSRRERRWRATQQITSFLAKDFLDDPAARSALRVLDRERLRFVMGNLQQWHAGRTEWPARWVAAAEESDMYLRLRPGDLTAMIEAMWDAAAPYVENQRPADDDTAEHVVLHLYAMPTKDPVSP
ncbi:MAG: winged helix-turn-helix domain-containing protein [Jiangellaceae bacterium]